MVNNSLSVSSPISPDDVPLICHKQFLSTVDNRNIIHRSFHLRKSFQDKQCDEILVGWGFYVFS